MSCCNCMLLPQPIHCLISVSCMMQCNCLVTIVLYAIVLLYFVMCRIVLYISVIVTPLYIVLLSVCMYDNILYLHLCILRCVNVYQLIIVTDIINHNANASYMYFREWVFIYDSLCTVIVMQCILFTNIFWWLSIYIWVMCKLSLSSNTIVAIVLCHIIIV